MTIFHSQVKWRINTIHAYPANHDSRAGMSRIFSMTRISGSAFGHSISVPVPGFIRAAGIGEILGIGVGMLAISLIFLILLIITGQFAAISAVWPASNVTKITTNLANSVVTGSTFMTLIIFFAAVGAFFVMLGLALSAISKLKETL